MITRKVLFISLFQFSAEDVLSHRDLCSFSRTTLLVEIGGAIRTQKLSHCCGKLIFKRR